MNHINFLMLGLGNGAVFAALALALVVTYRASGVLNFATGAVAMFGAYTYAYLRKGALLLLVPGLPRRYHFGTSMAFVPALALTLVICGALGVLLYALVFRPLRAAVPVARAVGSLGVMVLLTALVAQSAGSEQVVVERIFPAHAYVFGRVRLNGDRLWLAVTIVAVALVLAALYRFTRFGLATRASAETEFGALVTGLKPEQIAVVNWAISAMVCGLAGVLIAPLAPLVPGTYTLFIVPALAAAVLGRFTAMTPAVLGGIAIGMLQSEAAFIHSTFSWTLSTGNAELIPLVLVLAVLLVRSKPLPTRGTLLQRSLGRSPRPRQVLAPLAVFVPAAVVLLLVTKGTIRGAVIVSMIMAVISLSLVVVTGYAGQISLAQLTLAGVGGFLLSRFGYDAGIPFPIAPLLAAAGAVVLGVLVGLPALRIRGLLVSVVTLTLAVTLEAVWFRNTDLNGGGASGATIRPAKLLWIDLSVGAGHSYPRLAFAFMVLATLALVATGIAVLRGSRLGAAMLAVRANERSAAAVGISVVQVKMIAFGIGAFVAGLGGALLAYQQQAITFESYSALAGLGVLTTTYLAGITSIQGGILAGFLAQGGLLYVIIDRSVRVGQWYGVVSGLGVILTVLRNPEGAVGPTHAVLERRRLARLAAVEAPGDRHADRQRHRPGHRPTDGHRLPPAGDGDGGTGEPAAQEQRPVLLDVHGLTVRYGGVVAVHELDLAVREGQIVGLIGPNGAGKTTALDALSGFVPCRGQVRLRGRELEHLPPHRRVAAGLGRTFQGVDLYDDLTVVENIGIGQHVAGESGARAAASLQHIVELLDLEHLRERNVAELSQGERQLVSIARALACRPAVLLLDEPAAGLDTAESLWLAERLRDLRAAGTAIVLVDHDMSLVLGLCDEIHVLDFGRVIASGSPEAIRRDPVVAEAYLGSSHAPEAHDGHAVSAHAARTVVADAPEVPAP